MFVTPALSNDIKAKEHILYEKGSFYIFDRGYNSFADQYRIHRLEAYFIFRAKNNLKIKRIFSRHCDKKSVICDQIGVFNTRKFLYYTLKNYAKYAITTKIQTESLFT